MANANEELYDTGQDDLEEYYEEAIERAKAETNELDDEDEFADELKEPLDILEEKQEALGKVWQTGLVLVQIYRDLPMQDERGNRISGKIRETNHRIGSDWFEKNVGGGTYHVIIRGPSRKKPNMPGKPILGRVNNIVIAGRPFIENMHPPPSLDEEKRLSSTVDDKLARMASETNKRLEAMLADRDREARERMARLEARQEQERRKAEELRRQREREMLESAQIMAEKEREAADREQARQKDFFGTILAMANDPSKDAAVREQIAQAQETMRRMSEDHMREMTALREAHRDEVERIRRDAQEAANTMRTDYAERERVFQASQAERERLLREEFDRRERDLRDATTQREQALRDEMDRRERDARSAAEKDEKILRAQLSEVKDELRAARDKVERLTGEASEAKFERIKAEMMASQAAENPGGLMGLAKNMEEFTQVAALLGMSKGGEGGGPDIMTQVTQILNTEAAQRVGAGLAAVVQGLASKGQQGQAPQAAQVPAPTSEAIAQWQQTQLQLRQADAEAMAAEGVRRSGMRRKTGRVTAEVEAADETAVTEATAARSATAVAEQLQEPVTESTVPQQVIDDVMADGEQPPVTVSVSGEQFKREAEQIIELITAGLDAGATASDIWQSVEPMLGGYAKLILGTHPDVIIQRVEGAAETPMSIRGRRLLKEALAHGRAQHGMPAL